MIDHIDNFLTKSEYYSIGDYCLRSSYFFGETDSIDTPPTGMISEISNDTEIYSLFSKKIYDQIPLTRDLKLCRMNINYFIPSDNPYFHIDHETGITCIYYLGPIKAMKDRWKTDEYHIDYGGETQFIIDNNSINILPITNRLSYFDANILHRASSYRNHYRFTVAIKYR